MSFGNLLGRVLDVSSASLNTLRIRRRGANWLRHGVDAPPRLPLRLPSLPGRSTRQLKPSAIIRGACMAPRTEDIDFSQVFH